jgi:hypothetical protein
MHQAREQPSMHGSIGCMHRRWKKMPYGMADDTYIVIIVIQLSYLK